MVNFCQLFRVSLKKRLSLEEMNGYRDGHWSSLPLSGAIDQTANDNCLLNKHQCIKQFLFCLAMVVHLKIAIVFIIVDSMPIYKVSAILKQKKQS